MNIETLKLFLEIAQKGSFAAVARDADTDASLISRRIATLEADLGYRLFDRTTRRLALTEAGKLLFDRVQSPLEELSQIQDEAQDVVSKPSGVLRLTTTTAFAERWLIPLLPAFRASYPGIDFDLVLTDAQIDLVANNIDLALRLGPRMEGPFIGTKLLATRYRVLASKTYLATHGPISQPEDLAQHDCIVFPLPGYRSRWRFRRNAQDNIREVALPRVMSISSALAIRRAALEGLGVTLLSEWVAADDMASGTLVDVFPSWEVSAADFDTAVWLLYPSRAYMPVKLRLFIDYLRAVA